MKRILAMILSLMMLVSGLPGYASPEISMEDYPETEIEQPIDEAEPVADLEDEVLPELYPEPDDLAGAINYGYAYVMTVGHADVYATADMAEHIFTITQADAILLTTQYVEQWDRSCVKVWFIMENGEPLTGFMDVAALSETALRDEEAHAWMEVSNHSYVATEAGDLPSFIIAGERPSPAYEDVATEETPPEQSEVPMDDMIEEPIPEADKPPIPDLFPAQVRDFVSVSTQTRVFQGVDDSTTDEYAGDLSVGVFVRGAAVQIESIEQDYHGREWYRVRYLYGDDFADGTLKWTEYGTAYVLASETEPTDEGFSVTDFAFERAPMVRARAASNMNGFSLKNINAPVPPLYAGQSGVHGSSGRDSEYPQIATLPGYGTIYATPHYLDGFTVYCLEHNLPGPGENVSGGGQQPTGPYVIVDIDSYMNTPGYSSIIYRPATLHAIAWVLRHTYPFMVVDSNDPNNENWSRVAGQFAIREVIKQMEGPQYVRDYWDMSNFYSASGQAPETYLNYARWLAANGIARGNITGNINISGKSVNATEGVYTGTVTLSTLERNRLTHFDAWASTFGETTTAIELAPEGTGYRARTRFAKFFNLPELMTLFREVADIKTADQLDLPTPKATFDTVVVKPSAFQQEMVQALSKRAAEVHSGIIDPRDDNMLKITSDGRKLGLDQRLINPLLPDDPQSKVNACVHNIHRIWDEGQDKKLTQLVFCDISTPKGAAAPREDAPKRDFNVYDDIRAKLIAQGIPPEQIAYIHDANTEARKKELFAKVRSGQVRVLMGSTAKMGAGTNVQDRLVALHDLDCPWRPGDLEQRAGRIVRQGNQNPEVHIYRYVTEGTFDAYLWQTVENKQKFISQIMTSKSPVRTCEDVDETALSYAEIKALCAGDPRIKEKMDLDVDVARLRLMKADHMSKQYRLEDQLLKYFPQEIEKSKGYAAGFEQDIAVLDAHPVPEKGFGMEIGGVMLMEKDKAGEAILQACKAAAHGKEMEVGSYRGLSMSLAYDSMFNRFMLTLRGEMSYRIELGNDVHGNLTRIENGLAQIPSRLESTQAEVGNLQRQMEAAKREVVKPFPQDVELAEKSARLAELDASLNLGGDRGDEKPPEQLEEDRARPSVLESLKTPCKAGASKKHVEMEAR